MVGIVDQLIQNRLNSRISGATPNATLAPSGQSQVDPTIVQALLANQQQPVNDLTQGFSNLANTFVAKRLVDEQQALQQALLQDREQTFANIPGVLDQAGEQGLSASATQQMLANHLLGSRDPQTQALGVQLTNAILSEQSAAEAAASTFTPESPEGKRVADRQFLVKAFGEESGPVQAFDESVSAADSDVMSPELFEQKLKLGYQAALAKAAVDAQSPLTKLAEIQARQQTETNEEKLKILREDAERERVKFADERKGAKRGVESSLLELQNTRDILDELLGTKEIAPGKKIDLDDFTGTFNQMVAARFKGSEAADIQSKFDTLKARSTFKALTDLKARGGTLGATSEGEINLLGQSADGVNRDQSTAVMKAELQKFRDQVDGTIRRLQIAFETDYGSEDVAAQLTGESGGQDLLGTDINNLTTDQVTQILQNLSTEQLQSVMQNLGGGQQ